MLCRFSFKTILTEDKFCCDQGGSPLGCNFGEGKQNSIEGCCHKFDIHHKTHVIKSLQHTSISLIQFKRKNGPHEHGAGNIET
jgi:hypothetical protein